MNTKFIISTLGLAFGALLSSSVVFAEESNAICPNAGACNPGYHLNQNCICVEDGGQDNTKPSPVTNPVATTSTTSTVSVPAQTSAPVERKTDDEVEDFVLNNEDPDAQSTQGSLFVEIISSPIQYFFEMIRNFFSR